MVIVSKQIEHCVTSQLVAAPFNNNNKRRATVSEGEPVASTISERPPIVKAGGQVERDDADADSRGHDSHAVRPAYPFDGHRSSSGDDDRSSSKRHRHRGHGGRRHGGDRHRGGSRDRDDDEHDDDRDEDERNGVGRAAASTDAIDYTNDLAANGGDAGAPVPLSRASLYGGGGGSDSAGGGGSMRPIMPVLVSHGGVPQPQNGASQGGGGFVTGEGVIASGYSAPGAPINAIGSSTGRLSSGVGCLPPSENLHGLCTIFQLPSDPIFPVLGGGVGCEPLASSPIAASSSALPCSPFASSSGACATSAVASACNSRSSSGCSGVWSAWQVRDGCLKAVNTEIINCSHLAAAQSLAASALVNANELVRVAATATARVRR